MTSKVSKVTKAIVDPIAPTVIHDKGNSELTETVRLLTIIVVSAVFVFILGGVLVIVCLLGKFRLNKKTDTIPNPVLTPLPIVNLADLPNQTVFTPNPES